MFMNLDIVENLYKGVKRSQDKIKGFHAILERHCPGEEWESFRDINTKEYQTFLYKSKLQIDDTLCPGIVNVDYLKL
jgi:hypothetical protein